MSKSESKYITVYLPSEPNPISLYDWTLRCLSELRNNILEEQKDHWVLHDGLVSKMSENIAKALPIDSFPDLIADCGKQLFERAGPTLTAETRQEIEQTISLIQSKIHEEQQFRKPRKFGFDDMTEEELEYANTVLKEEEIYPEQVTNYLLGRSAMDNLTEPLITKKEDPTLIEQTQIAIKKVSDKAQAKGLNMARKALDSGFKTARKKGLFAPKTGPKKEMNDSDEENKNGPQLK